MSVGLQSSGLKKDLGRRSAQRRQEYLAEVKLEAAITQGGRNDLAPSMQISWRDPGSLKLTKRQVRKRSPEQLERVVRSIAEFGIVVPVLIGPGDEIIAGQLVVEAARALRIPQVPCVTASHLSEEQCRLLRVTLNRLGEMGEWELEELRIEMLEIEAAGLDLSLSGFSSPELGIILLSPEGTEGDGEEEGVPPEKPVSRLGDLWTLGEHRLLCGDALVQESYALVLGVNRAHAVFTDPPWNIPIEGFVSGLGKHKHADFKMAAGEMSEKEFYAFLRNFLALCSEHVEDQSVLFAVIDWRSIAPMVLAGTEAGFALINMAIWNKGSGGMGGLYRSQHELIPVFCKGDTPRTNNVNLGKHGRDRTNVWSYPGANRRGSSAAEALAGHPTPKPVPMVEDALLDVTHRGEIVLDPFMGSGTTLLAAEKCGRVARGIELDPAYVDLCVRRWEALTGLTAIHEQTGLTYAELAATRCEADEAEA